MTEDKARVRLKIGQLEVEYEGASSFLQADLLNLMEKIVGFYDEHKAAIPADSPPDNGAGTGGGGPLDGFDHSTNTIAAYLNASTGPELIIAAAAHLSMVMKNGTFNRKDISDEMKSATTYYKDSMLGNLTASLNSLVKAKRLNQSAKDTYALSANETKTLEAKLAQSI